MLSYESNLGYVQAALGEMQAYLLSPVLFWTLPLKPPASVPPFPQLTLGNFLLSLDALAAADVAGAGASRADVRRLQAEWEAVRGRWAANIEAKAERELASRLRQWQGFIEDVLERQSADDYVDQVHPRLVAERLLDLLPERPEAGAARAKLDYLDARIAPFLEPGPLMLDPELSSIYPVSGFPFLYRRPSKSPRS